MDPAMLSKSGMMLGLGETREEVRQVLADLRGAGCDIVTIGQYLRPSQKHLPVERFVPPEEFAEIAEEGRRLGFRHVEAGPLVRSSYHAHKQVRLELREASGEPSALQKTIPPRAAFESGG
jgi:lipoic acid synthetase